MNRYATEFRIKKRHIGRNISDTLEGGGVCGPHFYFWNRRISRICLFFDPVLAIEERGNNETIRSMIFLFANFLYRFRRTNLDHQNGCGSDFGKMGNNNWIDLFWRFGDHWYNRYGDLFRTTVFASFSCGSKGLLFVLLSWFQSFKIVWLYWKHCHHHHHSNSK